MLLDTLATNLAQICAFIIQVVVSFFSVASDVVACLCYNKGRDAQQECQKFDIRMLKRLMLPSSHIQCMKQKVK